MTVGRETGDGGNSIIVSGYNVQVSKYFISAQLKKLF